MGLTFGLTIGLVPGMTLGLISGWTRGWSVGPLSRLAGLALPRLIGGGPPWRGAVGVSLEALGGVRQPLLGRAEVVLADPLDARLHLLHLLLGVGVGDLEVAEVVEEPADLLVEAVGPAM